MSNAHHDIRPFRPVNIAILTISDTRVAENDVSGRTLVERLKSAGHQLVAQGIVPDDLYQIRAIISTWIATPTIHVIITSGGTGLTGRDKTPEAIKPLLDKEIMGFGELFRALSFAEIKTTSLHSRAFAGVANGIYIFCLPGSAGACKTAWDQLIMPQLDYRTQPCNLVEMMTRLLEV